MHCRWLFIKRGRVGISLSGFTLPHFYACSKPGLEFPTWYFMMFYVKFFEVKMIFDIGKIVDHHCLNFLFIMWCIYSVQIWFSINNVMPGRKTQPTMSCLAEKHNQQSRAWQENATNNVPGRKTLATTTTDGYSFK